MGSSVRYRNLLQFLKQSPWRVSVRIVWCMVMVSITGTETWTKDADVETHENIGYLWTVTNVNTSRSTLQAECCRRCEHHDCSRAFDLPFTATCLTILISTDASKMWSTRTQGSAEHFHCICTLSIAVVFNFFFSCTAIKIQNIRDPTDNAYNNSYWSWGRFLVGRSEVLKTCQPEKQTRLWKLQIS